MRSRFTKLSIWTISHVIDQKYLSYRTVLWSFLRKNTVFLRAINEIQLTDTQKWFIFKLAFLVTNIKCWSCWTVCYIRFQIYRPSHHDSHWLNLLPSLTSFSHYLLHCILLFFKFTYQREFLFCLPSEAKNCSWKLFIKNDILLIKTILKHILSTYSKNEIYLQSIHSCMNIAHSHMQFHLLLTTTSEANCPGIFPFYSVRKLILMGLR